jgi:signal transduction histidine kinase
MPPGLPGVGDIPIVLSVGAVSEDRAVSMNESHRAREGEAEDYALQVLERRNRAFRVLYDTVLKVEGATEEEIFSILCRNLLKISEAAVAALASYDPVSRTMTLEAVNVDAEGEDQRWSAEECIGETVSVTVEVVDDLRKVQLRDCPNHRACLVEFFPDAVPQCANGTKCYRLSCVREGELIAAAMIQLHPGQKIKMKDMIDTYLSTAGVILQRVYAVKALRESEEHVRRLNEELEQRVIERTTELRAANKELEGFAYSVAHELRSPLRSMDGFSLALLEDYGDRLDADGQDCIRRVRAASQRMAQLVDDLLYLSRVTRREVCRERVDLSALARTITAELQGTQPERQVEFVIAKGVVAQGDSHLLRVVMESLLDNAWKFTSKHPRARIEFGITKHDGEVTYFVRDDGVGFDMTYADKLFGTFQRLHAITEFEGTGVGLATVQRIIDRHGGRVWAEGAPEQGATFYFTV